MANRVLKPNECGPGTPNQPLDTLSPSQSLLQRLKELREYQEQQRALLLQVHSDSPLDLSVCSQESSTSTNRGPKQSTPTTNQDSIFSSQSTTVTSPSTTITNQDTSVTASSQSHVQDSTSSYSLASLSSVDESGKKTLTDFNHRTSPTEDRTLTPARPDCEVPVIHTPEAIEEGCNERNQRSNGNKELHTPDLPNTSLSRPPLYHPCERNPDEESAAYWSGDVGGCKTERHISSQESLEDSGQSTPLSSSDTGLATTWPSGRSASDEQSVSSVPPPPRDFSPATPKEDAIKSDYTDHFFSSLPPNYSPSVIPREQMYSSRDTSESDYTELVSERSVMSNTSEDYTSARESTTTSLEPESAALTSQHSHSATSLSSGTEDHYEVEKYRVYSTSEGESLRTRIQYIDQRLLHLNQKPVHPDQRPIQLQNQGPVYHDSEAQGYSSPTQHIMTEMSEELVANEPQVKFRFLKKGEGTNRFRMKPPVRFRKREKKPTDNDEALIAHMPTGSVRQRSPAQFQGNKKVRLPMKQLQLRDMPPLSKPKVLEENPKPQIKKQANIPKQGKSSQPDSTKKGSRTSPNTGNQGRAVPGTHSQANAGAHTNNEGYNTHSHSNTRPLPHHNTRPPTHPSYSTATPATLHQHTRPSHNAVNSRQPQHPDTNTSASSHMHYITQPQHPDELMPPVPLTPTFEKQRQKEEQQLSAFEKLEELVDDSSFSSNSSTVWGLLKHGQHSISSTPVRTPPPFSPKETPVHASSGRYSVGPNGNNPTLGNPHPMINIDEILQQLKAIVRLEGHDSTKVSEFLQSFSDHPSLGTPEAVERFAASLREISSSEHPTSTPADPSALQPSQSTPSAHPKPHVHFGPEAVEVMEYELSDNDDTLTDATSLAEEDSDLLSASDMEVLTQYIREAPGIAPQQQRGLVPKLNIYDNQLSRVSEESDNDATLTPESPSPNHTTSAHTRRKKKLQPVALEFSPPTPKPENCPSHYIWSIFGKDKNAKRDPVVQQVLNQQDPNRQRNSKQDSEGVNREAERNESDSEARVERKDGGNGKKTEKKNVYNDDVEAHKTLLLAKMAELEGETKIFKRENSKLIKLQHETQEERKALAEERKKLEEETAKEKKRLQEYIDRERNALWKERQQGVSRQGPTISSVREDSMEIVYLKEQIQGLKEEVKKKESVHQFSLKKLNERIRLLEMENKELRNKNAALQKLEKENLDLRCKLDRVKASARSQTTNPRQKSAKENIAAVSSKAKSVDGVNRSLDRLARPQVAIVREHEAGYVSSGGIMNKNNQQQFSSDCETVVSTEDKIDGINSGDGTIKGYKKVEFGSVTVVGRLDNANCGENMNIMTNQPVSLMLRGRAITSVGKRHTDVVPTEKPGPTGAVVSRSEQPSNIPSPIASKPSTTTLGRKQYEAFPRYAAETENMLSQIQGLTSPDSWNLDFTETVKEDGTREIIYSNGNSKEVQRDGTTIVNYYNGDRKEVWEDRTVYIYGTDKTRHTTYSDGREELVFPSGQRETRYPDKSSEVHFPDGSRTVLSADGVETCYMTDRTIVCTNPDGSKVFEFPSGQREVHMGEEKRREYPDGTVKILHGDGRTETIYRTGRRRVKDADGNILLDTHAHSNS
ncbi:hypothetical protein Pcinc_027823 [Petrolisthes cinctipes]|uniref:Centromere protein J C-terminal domain-containing protein n=1 Tax=Petrolisthes cinctipes TaxID=88211 RepID=A0AAE1F3M4_PETCI|nr:hypothetical protein Pcinc_027823 [Petrolisthes cinctipes]